MTLCQKCYLFLISEFSWKDFVTRNEINQFLFVSHAVDVLAYVLRVVWWLWSTASLFKCSNGLWYRRQPPRLVNLHSFGLVASLVNNLPKRPPYATEIHVDWHETADIWLKWTACYLSCLAIYKHLSEKQVSSFSKIKSRAHWSVIWFTFWKPLVGVVLPVAVRLDKIFY